MVSKGRMDIKAISLPTYLFLKKIIGVALCEINKPSDETLY